LLLVDGSDTTRARAKSQVSNYTGQIMLTPYIDKGLLYDVYIAPLEFRPAEFHRHALTLTKGEAHEYNGWNLTFVRFDMTPHGDAQTMRVGAVIQMERDGNISEIIPAMESGPEGRMSNPVPVPGTQLSFTLVGMSVEQKSVTLEVDDPETASAAGMSETLAVSVSRKPLASLVWIGCVLISAGTVLSYRKRRLEERLLSQAPSGHDSGSSASMTRRPQSTVAQFK
jgi:hypothetical protein